VPGPRRPSTQEPTIPTALGLVAVALLIAANAFFVAAEFALMAVDRSRIDQRAEGGDRRAGLVRTLVRHLSFHLSGAQLGITVTSLVVGVLAAPLVSDLLRPILEPLVGGSAAGGVGVVVGLVLATAVQMVVGELVPKTLAIALPEATAVRLARPVHLYGVVFGPVVRFLNAAANATVRAVGIVPREELATVRSLPELQLLFQSSTDEGTLARSAGQLLARTIRLADKTAADALVPRLDVVAVDLDTTLVDLAALSCATGHSRFPVHGADLDDVRGVVHVGALFGVPRDARARTTVAEVMGEALVVPESRDLDDLLADLRSGRNHLAVVVDEYGGTAGIITLEDVLEEIVGEISDEYDTHLTGLARPDGDGAWSVTGLAHPDEVEALCGFTVPEGDYETLAGFVLEQLGRVPRVGDRLVADGWGVEVLEMDRHRVARVRLTVPGVPPEGSAP
jgi:CBS domain containing-hemolysin-like protein